MKREIFLMIILVLVSGTAYGFTCPDNMSEMSGFSSTFSAPDDSLHCAPGYQLFDVPDAMLIKTSGFILGTGAELCADGEYRESGVCTPAPQGLCESGYYRLPGQEVSLYKLDNNKCFAGFQKVDLPTSMYNIANGYVFASGESLCDDGYRKVGDNCVAYDVGDCPAGMFSYEPSSDSFLPITFGACGTGYVAATDNKSCGDSNSDDSKCAVLCDAGENWTYQGVCAARCTVDGLRILHVGDLAFTTYADKTTEHALVFDNGDARCYGNMTSGRGDGTLNTKLPNGETWRLTE